MRSGIGLALLGVVGVLFVALLVRRWRITMTPSAMSANARMAAALM